MSWLGLYEKAIPKDITWKDRLQITKDLGFDFLEISVDESDDRLSRLDWPLELKTYISQISAIHLKDTLPVGPKSLGQFRDLVLGEGTVDFVEVFKALKEVSYQGSFVLELWGDNVLDYKQQILTSLSFIKEQMVISNYR